MAYTIVQKNPGIRYNHILRIIVEHLDAMSKRTAEKILKELENRFQITKEGYNNKRYELKSIAKDEIIKSFQPHLNGLDEYIKKLEKKESRLSSFKRAETIASLLQCLYSIYPVIVLVEEILNYTAMKKQKDYLDKLIQRTYNLTREKYVSTHVLTYLTSQLENELQIKNR